jgi:hypothetical protein
MFFRLMIKLTYLANLQAEVGDHTTDFKPKLMLVPLSILSLEIDSCLAPVHVQVHFVYRFNTTSTASI